MKILLVIHGYPPGYNAGSEVYTQGIAQALALNHEVHVFTRTEDALMPEYHLSSPAVPPLEEGGSGGISDADCQAIKLHVVNVARGRDRYRHEEVDRAFEQLLQELQPDIIHIGHLNHLSTSLVELGKKQKIPILYTLHDFWLMCPRGQFIQMYPEDPTDTWALCDGQVDEKCAKRCYARYFSGAEDEAETDIAYWTDWVKRRMAHIREICGMIDLFIAPSQYLLEKFHGEFGLPAEKLIYLDYGFHRSRLVGRVREPEADFTFGYIGTHIPAKGVHLLIKAFGELQGSSRLRVWGRHRQETKTLKAIAASLPPTVAERIEWMGEYSNPNIVTDVFDKCDAIVVPSIWGENSPLVIHEAQQVRIPVITANYGGMAEYVRHEVNGLLFNHRDYKSLASAMQRFVDRRAIARKLGERGYLNSSDGNVPSMPEHVQKLEELYAGVINNQTGTVAHHLRQQPG